ncbi:MAG: LuxR C-terminal-related transcriptional regulator [Acutalibacteraceae bacterium]
MAKTRVLVVDDQLIVRQLFEMYLKSSDKYEIAGLLPSAAQVYDHTLLSGVDLITLDMLMNDGSNGLDVAQQIKKTHPWVKIVAITSMVEASWLKRAKDIGIESFYYKEAPQAEILDVLDRTIAGESVYPDTPPEVAVGLTNSENFSERELEVLRLMTTGMSNQKIAKKLNISEGTVKTYIHRMLELTGFNNRTELAIEARVRGIAVNIDQSE